MYSLNIHQIGTESFDIFVRNVLVGNVPSEEENGYFTPSSGQQFEKYVAVHN